MENKMTWSDYVLQEMNYKTKTTFWDDFSIAEYFGPEAIVDTCKDSLRSYHDNIEYLTELALVLNHKMFVKYDKNEKPYMELYRLLYLKIDEYIKKRFGEEELSYYYRITD